MIELRTLPPEQRQAYIQFFDAACEHGHMGFKYMKPAKEYDIHGLRFPIDYLNQMGKNTVLLPVEYMADYVDVITKEAVDSQDEKFIFEQLIDEDINIQEIYDSINATTIGNLAYIYLNSNNERGREIAKKALNEIFVITKGRILNYLNETIV